MFRTWQTTCDRCNQAQRIITHGFSLIELMIVLGIIGIISLFSFPLYSNHITHTHRLEAEINLIKLANALEHYQVEHNSYQDATLETLGFSDKIVDNLYQLEIATASEAEFVIKAIPLEKQAEHDALCGSLLLYSSGKRGVTGKGDLVSCWV